MRVFAEYLDGINEPEQRDRMEEILWWVSKQFPDLEPVIKWNQPMFTYHGTFIIAFSTARNHISVSPERIGMVRFEEEMTQAGYEQSKELFRIKWEDDIDFPLLQKIIAFNMIDKADCETFWRQ